MSYQSYPDGTDPHTIPLDVPFKTPPAGQASNFDHPNVILRDSIIVTASINLALTLALALALALAIFTSVTRCGTRLFIVRRFGWDDYIRVVAVVIVVAFNAASLEREWGIFHILHSCSLQAIANQRSQEFNTGSVYRLGTKDCDIILSEPLRLLVLSHDHITAFRPDAPQILRPCPLPPNYGRRLRRPSQNEIHYYRRNGLGRRIQLRPIGLAPQPL